MKKFRVEAEQLCDAITVLDVLSKQRDISFDYKGVSTRAPERAVRPFKALYMNVSGDNEKAVERAYRALKGRFILDILLKRDNIQITWDDTYY